MTRIKELLIMKIKIAMTILTSCWLADNCIGMKKIDLNPIVLPESCQIQTIALQPTISSRGNAYDCSKIDIIDSIKLPEKQETKVSLPSFKDVQLQELRRNILNFIIPDNDEESQLPSKLIDLMMYIERSICQKAIDSISKSTTLQRVLFAGDSSSTIKTINRNKQGRLINAPKYGIMHILHKHYTNAKEIFATNCDEDKNKIDFKKLCPNEFNDTINYWLAIFNKSPIIRNNIQILQSILGIHSYAAQYSLNKYQAQQTDGCIKHMFRKKCNAFFVFEERTSEQRNVLTLTSIYNRENDFGEWESIDNVCSQQQDMDLGILRVAYTYQMPELPQSVFEKFTPTKNAELDAKHVDNPKTRIKKQSYFKGGKFKNEYYGYDKGQKIIKPQTNSTYAGNQETITHLQTNDVKQLYAAEIAAKLDYSTEVFLKTLATCIQECTKLEKIIKIEVTQNIFNDLSQVILQSSDDLAKLGTVRLPYIPLHVFRYNNVHFKNCIAYVGEKPNISRIKTHEKILELRIKRKK